MSLYSQETLRNTSLTDKDTVKITVNYRYIVAARMLYRDYVGLKKVENQQLYTIQSQERQIQSLLKQASSLKSADSLLQVKSLNDSTLLLNYTRENKSLKVDLRNAKAAKIGVSISLPVVAVLSFLLGWYLHQ